MRGGAPPPSIRVRRPVSEGWNRHDPLKPGPRFSERGNGERIMKGRSSLLFYALPLAAAIAIAATSFGQQVRQVPLRENPYRNPGGSCLYGADGRVVHAPNGVYCPDKTDQSKSSRSSTSLDTISASKRDAVEKLLGDHEHISRELVRLRKAIGSDDKSVALELTDHITTRLRDHRLREERFMESAFRR